MPLSRRHFIRQFAAAGCAGLNLTARAEAPVHCVYGEDYLPWSGCGDGTLRGIAPELVDAFLGRQLKLALYQDCAPWKRAQIMVETGRADAMCTIPTEARREYALVSAVPLFSTGARIYISRNSPLSKALVQAKNLAALQLQNPIVLTYIGSGWTVERLTGFRTDTAPNMMNCIKMLAVGRGDIMVENRLVMQNTISSLGLGDDIVAGQFDMEAIHYHLMVGKKSPHAEIMARLNAQLPAFKTSAAYKKILAGYSVEI